MVFWRRQIVFAVGAELSAAWLGAAEVAGHVVAVPFGDHIEAASVIVLPVGDRDRLAHPDVALR